MNPVAFVVTVDLDPSINPESLIDPIASAVSNILPVIEVNPWDRPSSAPPTFAPPPSDFL